MAPDLRSEVLTVAEVAEILHSSPKHVHELRKQGVLRAIPHTNRPVLFSRRALEEFIGRDEPVTATVTSPGTPVTLTSPATPAATRAQKQTYSVEESATLLGVSDDNLYDRLREDGTVAGVRGIRIGTSWRIPKDPLDALVSGRARPVS